MILRSRLKGVVSSPALCPGQFSYEAPIRHDRRHWLSSVCLTLLDPWSRVVQLHQPVHDLSFVSRSQPCGPCLVTFQQAFSSSPTCFAVAPSFKVCPAKVGPRNFVFHQHLSGGAKHHLCKPLHSDLNVKCIVTAIWRPRDSSRSEYSVRVPSPTQEFS